MAEKVSKEEVERTKAPSKSEGAPPESGLEILGPTPEFLKLSIGEAVLIAPMKMGQLRRFLDEAGKLIPLIQHELSGSKDGVNLSRMMALDSDGVMKAISIATGVPVEVMDALGVDEFAKLAAKVLVVNLDFFSRTLPAVLEEGKAAVLAATKRGTAGASPSKG